MINYKIEPRAKRHWFKESQLPTTKVVGLSKTNQ